MPEARKAVVYHHTHWDREWWATFQDYRMRLVELVDELLDTMEQDPAFPYFLLDGQTIVLKDYLQIRPENKEKLLGLIRSGRIGCGPWHILPDEFLVSGEAHVRNLWLGRRTAREYGIEMLPIGYLPDTFGHISQMPQLLRGFGLDKAMLWRGVGGEPETFKSEFYWESPDGSRVFTHWLCNGYYLLPFELFGQPDRTVEGTIDRVKTLLDSLGEHASASTVLLPYGADHRKIDRSLGRWISEMNEALRGEYELSSGTIEQYMDIAYREQTGTRKVTGELRQFGPHRAMLLPGVLSTRMYLKQLNFDSQLALERYAEPFSAIAWMTGSRYESEFLWQAWELLIQNHPHDSICGCSIDQVHREMIPRFEQSKQIANLLTHRSMDAIHSRMDTSELRDGERAIVIHNPLPWKREGLAKVLLPLKECIHPRTHVLRDATGQEVPFQTKTVEELTYMPQMCNDWQHTEVSFVARNVPELGYAAYRLEERGDKPDHHFKHFHSLMTVASNRGSSPGGELLVGSNRLENSFLQVEADARNGTLAITDRTSGLVYKGLHYFEDGGDEGDEYNYSKPLNDVVIDSRHVSSVHISIHEAGYASATLKIELEWALPQRIASDGLSRVSEYAATRMTSYVTMAAYAKRVDIRTEWENNAKDHRLRAMFPLGEAVQLSHAEGHFDVVERRTSVEPGHGWVEPEPPTKPQQGYVSIKGSTGALTIANKGLPEFEAMPDGTLAVTLLRSVGWLTRETQLARGIQAGPELPTPEGQCLGAQAAEYSIIPHANDWLSDKSYRDAHEFIAPLAGALADKHEGEWPLTGSFIEMEGDHTLMLSAIKKAEDSESLLLRFWNVSKTDTSAVIRLRRTPTSVAKVRLDEQAAVTNASVPVAEDGRFPIQAAGAQIVTLKIDF